MMLKQVIRDQYRSKFDQLIDIKQISRPKEGWIRTLRKALGMSSPQLAARLAVSKSQASQMERMEAEDRISLKQLRRVADVLDCDLVYALVPRQSVETTIRKRARHKAEKLVERTDVQMKLEAQQLSSDKLYEQVRLESDRLVREMPRDLWED
jgi:predicted DNA-binding mobile mystery protein A